MHKHAEPGTISSGTLEVGELINRFRKELRRLASYNVPHEPIAREHMKLAAQAQLLVIGDVDADMWMLSSLGDALEMYAPPGHTFGAHEGDGADFGFWQICH